MGSKFRVSFNVDLEDIEGARTEAEAASTIRRLLIGPARDEVRKHLEEVKTDSSLSADERLMIVQLKMQTLMLTMMAELNLEIEPLDDATEIAIRYEFEQGAG